MGITKILKDEHRVIEVVLTCLNKITEEANLSGKLNAETANQALDIIRTFADKCHHGKEENHLFTTLVNKGIANEGGPVGQMLLEHEEGRSHVNAMAKSITKASEGDKDSIKTFTENSGEYVNLLRSHIQKEDKILFPMADKILTDEDQNKLMNDFKSVESDHMGSGTHERYIDLVLSLARSYEVEATHIANHSCGCKH